MGASVGILVVGLCVGACVGLFVGLAFHSPLDVACSLKGVDDDADDQVAGHAPCALASAANPEVPLNSIRVSP